MANWRPLLYIAAGNKATDDPYTWIDYTRYLRDDKGTAIRTQRGRQDETQHHNNGTLAAVLDNRDRTFVRDNNAWVQSDTPVQYLLEYPWLPGKIPNGGFEQGWTKWGIEAGSPLTGVVTSVTEAADAGAHFFQGSFATNEGIKSAPCDLTGIGASGSQMALSWRGVTRTPGTQLQAHIRWYSDAACTAFISDTLVTCVVDHFLDVEPIVDDFYEDLYTDVYDGDYVVFKWKRFGTLVTPPGGTNGATVSIINLAANDIVALDSVVFDAASFQAVEKQYTGYANSWDRTWEVGDATCDLACDDGFKPLSKTKFSSKTYSQFILRGGDFSTGAIAEASISRVPDHYFQLNEPGSNNQATSFRDSISGDTRPTSEIGKGVGSLYQVAGLVPTDAAFAWSSLGPSSDDGGWISFPADYALGAHGSSWAAAAWVRAIDGASMGVQYVFEQGVFDTLAGFHLPDSEDGCVLYVNHSNIVGSTAQNINFDLWSGLDFNTGLYTGHTGFRSVEIHDALGLNFWDQAPHLIGVIVDGTRVRLFYDGVKILDTTSGTAVSNQPSGPILYLGKATGFYSQVGDSIWIEKLEYQHFMQWITGQPTEADMTTLHDRAITMYPQEDSGSRIHHILDIVHWPASLRTIDTGSSQVEKVTAPFSDESAHSYNQKVEDAEQGWMFIGSNGSFRWKNRQSFFKVRNSQATFGTGPGEIPYADVTIVDDDTLIYNQGITSRSNSAPVHEVDDFPSQDQHFISTLERTDLLLVSEDEAQASAETIVDKYAEQKEALTKLVLEATAGRSINNDAVIRQIMQREIGHRITVRTREPGQVGYKEWIGIIQGISHTVSRGKLTCTWDVTTLAVKDYFVFGDVFGSYPMGW